MLLGSKDENPIELVRHMAMNPLDHEEGAVYMVVVEMHESTR